MGPNPMLIVEFFLLSSITHVAIVWGIGLKPKPDAVGS
jgi:hypothetical protein